MGNINKLEEKILGWAHDRGILQNSNAQVQGLKLVSEIGELADNLAKGRNIEDDIGDAIVVLSIIANMKGTTLTNCVNKAWGDIKDRKGYLNEDGIFIKDTDSEQLKLPDPEEDPTIIRIDYDAANMRHKLSLSNGTTYDLDRVDVRTPISMFISKKLSEVLKYVS